MVVRPSPSVVATAVLLVLGLSAACVVTPGRAAPPPDSTLWGVVWTPPEAPGPALRALSRIDAAGADAVRLTRPPADTIYDRADALNLRLFVDLPVAYVQASALQDSLAAAPFDRLLRQAARHPALHAVGLARSANTTAPAACEALAEWTRRAHRAAAPLRTYYVTPFTAAADRCASSTDAVLLDRRASPHPVSDWRAWSDTAASDVGIGLLGTWVRPEAPSGLRVPHSPERQARYLERALRAVTDLQSPPSVTFVYRWRDSAPPLLSSRRYGLHTRSDTARPAAQVVQGFFRGTQRTFAFPAGTPPTDRPYGLLLIGWGLVALLAVLYARRPFVRETTARYFRAHGFYRDAVREGRDLEPFTNGTLLLVVAAALGIVGTCAARAARLSPATEHLLAALPPGAQSLLAGGVAHPATAGVVIGTLVLGLLLFWIGMLVGATWWEGACSLAQGFTLVTWPCWIVLPALPIALVTLTHPPLPPLLLTRALGVGVLLVPVWVTVRGLRDYRAVAAPDDRVLPLLAVLSPPALLLVAGAVTTIQLGLSPLFLWRLLTQT